MWKSPYPVVLTILKAVKAIGIIPLVHYTELKEATVNNEDKNNTGPMTMIILFCLLCLPKEKTHNPHKPI